MTFKETMKMAEIVRKRRSICGHLNRYRARLANDGNGQVDMGRVLFARLFPQNVEEEDMGGNVHPIKPQGPLQ